MAYGRLYSCARPPGPQVLRGKRRMQLGAKHLPGYHRSERYRRIFLLIQSFIPPARIKKNGLPIAHTHCGTDQH
jgi:hypothetical protein